MKNSLLLLAGFAALSLTSCSQTATTDTTTADAPKDGASMATASTTGDDMYHTRGNRMADKFVGDMKITDEAMKEKIRTAYYNRSKRYGMMKEKYGTDTTGMGAAMRQYTTDTDAEFQTILTDKSQYQSYQSSRSTYDESGNMDQTDQGAATGSSMSSDNGSTSNGSSSSDMSNGSADGSTGSGSSAGSTGSGSSSSDMSTSGSSDMSSGSGVEKSKSKMSDGSKVKVKTDGSVKTKDGDGTKTKM